MEELIELVRLKKKKIKSDNFGLKLRANRIVGFGVLLTVQYLHVQSCCGKILLQVCFDGMIQYS